MSFVFHPHVIAVHGLKYQGCLILTLHTYMKILSIFGVLSGPVTGGGVCACTCHSMSGNYNVSCGSSREIVTMALCRNE